MTILRRVVWYFEEILLDCDLRINRTNLRICGFVLLKRVSLPTSANNCMRISAASLSSGYHVVPPNKCGDKVKVFLHGQRVYFGVVIACAGGWKYVYKADCSGLWLEGGGEGTDRDRGRGRGRSQ